MLPVSLAPLAETLRHLRDTKPHSVFVDPGCLNEWSRADGWSQREREREREGGGETKQPTIHVQLRLL